MATPSRRGLILPVSRQMVLAAADDLDGVQDNTKSYDVSGATRIIVVVDGSGTAGTVGVDIVCISHDGGSNWTPVTDLLPIDSHDITGTVQVGGALEVAGVEPTTASFVFKCGPYEGPTAIRVIRKTGDVTGAATWVTGAPAVRAFTVGGIVGAQAALA